MTTPREDKEDETAVVVIIDYDQPYRTLGNMVIAIIIISFAMGVSVIAFIGHSSVTEHGLGPGKYILRSFLYFFAIVIKAALILFSVKVIHKCLKIISPKGIQKPISGKGNNKNDLENQGSNEPSEKEQQKL